MDLTEEDLQSLYTWVDDIPLSRPKRNIARDFADGVLLAETVSHFFPRLVELHNYSSANGMQQKLYNWNTLNQKVLRKLGVQLTRQQMNDVSAGLPGAIESILKIVKVKIADYQEEPSPTWSGRTTPRGGQLIPGSQQLDIAAVNKGHPARAAAFGLGSAISSEVLADKERSIVELRETNEILETKVRKLEQLVKLKDAKIHTLVAKLQTAGLA